MKSQRKRKKVTRKVNLIDGLPESLLSLEIFSKLRNPRDIIVCKSVSKSWNSILSSSSFSSLHQKQSWGLILNTHPPQCVTNDTCLEDWKGFQLNNYVDLNFKSSSKVCVLASYRDILLCMKSYYTERRPTQFYLVNPVTMRWTRVPKTTSQYSDNPIGLSGDASKSRFYVVKLITFEVSKINFSVFDSKLAKWRERYIRYPSLSHFGGPWPLYLQALNFNGALHWLAHDGPIVAYNPEFDHKRKCRFIHRSQEMRHASYGDLTVVSETLTVSMGHLRILQLVCYHLPNDHHHLVIWTLVDYEQSIWKQENHHEPVYFRDMLSDLPWIQDYMQGYTLDTKSYKSRMSILMRGPIHLIDQESSKLRMICPHPLHCHPDNPLLLYLNIRECIVSLDVATKKLRLIARTSPYCTQNKTVTPITLYLDPSLVPDHERVLLPHL